MKLIIRLGALVPLSLISIFLAFWMVQVAINLFETVQMLDSTLNMID